MNPRTTWFLVTLAAICFAGILVFERPYRATLNKKPDTHVLPELQISNIISIQISSTNQFIRIEKTNQAFHFTKPISYPADSTKTKALLKALAEMQWQAHITSEELRERPKAQQEFGFDVPQFSIALQNGQTVYHLQVGNTPFGAQTYLQVVGGDGVFLVDAQFLKLLPENPDAWRDAGAVSPSAFDSNSLEVRSGPKNSFRLELNATNGLWFLTKPLEARANSEKIFQLLAQLSVLKTTNFIADDARIDFEKFGLPNTPTQVPELELLFLRGTNVVEGLQIGTSPTNNSDLVYASRLKYNAVFTLPKEPLTPWLAPYTEFRNRHLIDLLPEAVTNIQIRGEDNFTLERGPSGWRVIEPENFVADSDLIDREMLLVLSKLEANFENDVVTDFSTFGLTNPALQMTLIGSFTNLTTGKRDLLSELLTFGTMGTNRVFVRRDDQRRVFAINPQEFELLPRSSWQLRDRRIWNFDSTNVLSVTIQQFGRTKKMLRKGENDWDFAPGSQGSINPPLLEEAMHRLGELKAIFWVSPDESNRAKFGFTEADHKISIELKRGDKTEILELEFGSYSPYMHPYGATIMNGKRVVFEFPLPLFFEFVRRDLSIVPPSLPPEK